MNDPLYVSCEAGLGGGWVVIQIMMDFHTLFPSLESALHCYLRPMVVITNYDDSDENGKSEQVDQRRVHYIVVW